MSAALLARPLPVPQRAGSDRGKLPAAGHGPGFRLTLPLLRAPADVAAAAIPIKVVFETTVCEGEELTVAELASYVVISNAVAAHTRDQQPRDAKAEDARRCHGEAWGVKAPEQPGRP